ncbi:MAG: hypothetical protein ABI597_08590 [Gammaproteobacteria bacterium]
MAKFSKGVSGNPGGRKPGTGYRQQVFNALIVPHREAIIQRALQMALGGSESMLKVFLDRMLPAKPIDEPAPPMSLLGDSLVQQGKEILALMTSGALTPSEGMALINALSSQSKLMITDELIKRIEQLEEQCYARTR